MIDARKDDEVSVLDEFAVDADVAELAVVEDLWYFVYKNGNWVMGSG